ncbi:hypothetical protein NE237_012213 [Protea cynaroides]|uniref:Cornichon n=1 Tax=Protea cynaroides TaxID=273540 RepID=A0A9Q0JYL2_9MAGN|nr:hypothetical protein NE237_012213 [Protea cynaroides]
MFGAFFVWLLSFFMEIALVCLIVYQLISLADLEFDYINPYDSAKRINSVVLPEFATQAFLSFFFLFTGHWFMFLLSVPYVCYNVRIYTQKQHFVDITEIFNMLNWEKKIRIVKLAYVIILFCLTLFWMIYSALED